MAWLLPYYTDVLLIGNLLRLLPPLIVVLDLIEIEEHGAACEFGATLPAPGDFLGSTSQAGDGIAGAETEVYDLKVNRTALGLQKIVEQLAIGLLGLSLTAQKDRRFGFYDPTAHPHPTCGTAPYTPPRYFL